MSTNAQRAERWMDVILGKKTKNLAPSGNVFVDYGNPDKIWSYGHHFCLAEVMRNSKGKPTFVLINGDRYSSSTTQHQGYVRGEVARSGLDSIIVPFSALRSAEIDEKSIKPIEIRPDRMIDDHKSSSVKPEGKHTRIDPNDGPQYSHVDGRWTQNPEYIYNMPETPWEENPKEIWVNHTWKAHLDDDGIWRWNANYHRLGDSLFSAVSKGKRRKFLSSFDYQEGALYFLCELPRCGAKTVDEAFEVLKPKAVKVAEEMGRDIVRQGDLFAVETTFSNTEVLQLTPYSRGRVVKRPRVLNTNHEATHVVFGTHGNVFAKGCLYHNPRFRASDHRRQKLGDGKTWYLLYRNTVPQTETTRGRRGIPAW